MLRFFSKFLIRNWWVGWMEFRLRWVLTQKLGTFMHLINAYIGFDQPRYSILSPLPNHWFEISSGHKKRLYLHLMPSFFPSTENSQMLHPKGHMEFIVRLCCAHWWQHVKLWCRRCVAGVNRWLCWMVPHKLSAAIGYQSIERQWQRKLSRKTTQQHVLRLIRCKPAMSHQPHTRFFFIQMIYRYLIAFIALVIRPFSTD